MELTTLFLLLLAPLSSLVSANDLVYGRLAKPAAASSPDLPLKGISMRSQVEILYARINIDVFHGVFEDGLNKRQTCGSGTTCTAACRSCGSGYVWCGTKTGGSCDCSNSSGSCSNSGGGGGGGSGGNDICGSGRTCTSACSNCGSGYKWCGTMTGNACDCSSSSGTCSNGGGGGSEDESEDVCGSGKTCTGACKACGSSVIWCGTQKTPGTCDCSDLTGSCSSDGLTGGSDITTVTSSTRRFIPTSSSSTSTTTSSFSSRPTDSDSDSDSNFNETETSTSSSTSTTRSSSRAPSITAFSTSSSGGNGGASGANGRAEVGFGAILLGLAALVL